VGRLAADGVPAVDVPAKLSARVRLLSTGHGSKNDQVDAVSVAVAALHAVSLRSVEVDDTIAALRELTEHRDDLVKTRTQTINRLHRLLTQLLPGGAPTPPSADTAAGLLRRVRPDGTLGGTRRRLATDLIGEIRRLDRRIAALAELISVAVAESGSTLTGLCGIGDLGAAKLLGRVGCVDRFPTAAHFASYAGVAPREVSSGDVVRHRACRAVSSPMPALPPSATTVWPSSCGSARLARRVSGWS
jgi:transposase